MVNKLDKIVVEADLISGEKNEQEWHALAINTEYNGVIYSGLVFAKRDMKVTKAVKAKS